MNSRRSMASLRREGHFRRLEEYQIAALALCPWSRRRQCPCGNQQSCGWTRATTSPRRCAQPRGFLGVPPPDGGKSCRAVFRHQIGMAEAIPSRAAHIIIRPLRNDVVIPQQDAVECSRSRLEIGAIIGEDDLIDHGIDRWIFDANTVE